MKPFDAELYLRLLGEETLVVPGSPGRDPWGSPVNEPARALVAVGAIAAEDAEKVIDEYALARALRDEDAHHLHHRLVMRRMQVTPPQNAAPPKPRRVVACDAHIEIGHGTLHVRHVILAEDETKLGVTWHASLSPSASPNRRQGMFPGHPGGPPMPRVLDDRGSSANTHFSGGGSEYAWVGTLHTDSPLAADTAWIELDGTRLDLMDTPPSFEIAVEPLPEQPPAHRYLWQRLAAPDRHHGRSELLDPVLEALIAAGELEPDDPIIPQARRVAGLIPQHPGPWSPAGGASGLPEPWQSLLRRAGRSDGPAGSIAIGAITPEFDGFTVAVFSLDSAPEHFSAEVETTPGVTHRHPFSSEINPREIAWWAADDRGNHYLGTMGSWSGGHQTSEGQIQFTPALDPKARRLDILPTAQTSRARISVPLPWTDQAKTTEGQA